MKVTFKILRQKPNLSPKFDSYTIDVNPAKNYSYRLLNLLIQVN